MTAEKKSQIIRIAHEFPQAEMFQLSGGKERPWKRRYENQAGDIYSISAPASPGVREMVVFLGGIWFSQHPELALEFKELDHIRNIMTVRERDYLDIIHYSRQHVSSFWDSLLTLGEIVIKAQFANPKNHGGLSDMSLPGLFGDTERHQTKGREGIRGNTITYRPLKWFTRRQNRLSLDIEGIMTLKKPASRLIALYLTARQQSRQLPIPTWAKILGSRHSRLRNFRRLVFDPALTELASTGYTISEDRSGVKIGCQVGQSVTLGDTNGCAR